MADYDLGTARGRIEIDASTLGRTSAALDGVGKTMLGMGALALAGFGLAVKASADFERTMSGVKAVLAPTAAEMDALRAKTLQLGQDSIFSAKDVAEGMEAMAKAGLTADEMLSGAADAAVNLAAAAGNMDLDQAAEIAANAMRTFQLPAEEMVRVADIMAGAANASTVEVDDLAVSLKYAGAVANAMGVSFEETNTALAILGDRGIRGSTAGTSLRGVLLSLTGTSGPARDALRDLGIITEEGGNQFFTAEGKMKSMAEVAQILQDATKGLSEEQRAAAFNTIFQRRAMASAIILADQGAAGFAKYTAEIEKVSAADVAAEKLNNLSGDVEILRGSIETLVITAGGTMQDMLRGWVQQLTKVVNWLSSLDESTLKTIMRVILFGGAISGIIGTIFLFLGALTKMYRTFRDLQAAWKLFMSVMQSSSAGALLTNPWFLLAAAIVALGVGVYLAYQRFEGFRKVVDGVMKWLKDNGLPTVQGFVEGIKNFWNDLVGWTKAHWTEIQEAVGHVMRAIREVVGVVVDFVMALWRAWGEDLLNVVKIYFDYIRGTIHNALEFIQGIVQTVMALINGDWGKAWEGIKQAASAVWRQLILEVVTKLRLLLAKISAIGHLLEQLWNGLWDKLKDLASFFFNWLKTNWQKVLFAVVAFFAAPLAAIIAIWAVFGDKIKAVVGAAIDAVVNFFKLLPGRVVGFLDMLWETIWGVLSKLPGMAVDLGIQFLEAFADFMSKLPERAGHFLGLVIGTIVGFQLEVITKIIEFGVDFIKAYVDFMTKLPGRIWDFLTKAIDKYVDFQVKVISKIVDLGVQFIQAFVDFMTKLPGRIWDFLVLAFNKVGEWERNVITKVVELGVNFLQKVVDFLTKLPGKMWEFFQEAVRKVVDFGIQAIEKARNLGEKVVSAIIDRITELPGKVWDALQNVIKVFKDMVGDAFDAAKNFVGGLWDGFVSGLGDAPGNLVDAINPFDKSKKTTKSMLDDVKQISKAMSASSLSPQQALGIAQGAGVAPAASSPLATSPSAGTNQIGATREGDNIQIYGADQKTALQISQEIMFEKRVLVDA